MKNLILNITDTQEKIIAFTEKHFKDLLEEAIVIAQPLDSDVMYYFVEYINTEYRLYSLGHLYVNTVSYDELKTKYRFKIQIINEIFKNKE